MHSFSFGGHELVALPDAALFWPARNALLVADLHLEKASWFARAGQMLPPYDSEATVDRIAALLARTGARELWALGDSFHDDDGVARLRPGVRARITEIAARIDWHWVTGNHDRAHSDTLGGHIHTEALIDGLVLRHETQPGEARPEISGHYHPAFAVSLRGRRMRRRCFVHGENRLILPAFGALAGGLDVRDRAILSVAGRDPTAMVPIADRLLHFPLVHDFPLRHGFAGQRANMV